jgi:hypothetical protein
LRQWTLTTEYESDETTEHSLWNRSFGSQVNNTKIQIIQYLLFGKRWFTTWFFTIDYLLSEWFTDSDPEEFLGAVGLNDDSISEISDEEEVRKIWLADNTRLLPRKQIRSKDRDAARIVPYNRHREEIRIDVEICCQKLYDLKYGIWK